MKLRRVVVFVIVLVFGLPGSGAAGEIVDMIGRRVMVPEKIEKIYGTSPPATNLIYALDPGRLAGLNFPVNDREKAFMDKRLLTLPVVGGWFGQGHTPNMESLLAVRPDVILVWQYTSVIRNVDVEEVLRPLNAPVVFVVLDTLSDYPAVFRFMGELLGEETRTDLLAAYAEKTISDMERLRSAIPEKERVTVYYAENPDGLSTECTASIHAALIPLCGGVNVHPCLTTDGYGMDKVSMEQVLLYNPQVIITHDRGFYAQVSTDKRWQGIRAVRDNRIYLIPANPMNWFDRPPSFMRLLGARWLAHVLYPQAYPLDVGEETRRFYSLFLNHELQPAELEALFLP